MSIFHRLAIRAILKNTAPANEFEDFCFFISFGDEIDSGPFLGCFGVPKSFQKRPKKRLQRCFKSSLFFGACLSPNKLFFWPTWPQHGPKINPPAPPSWAKNRSKIGPKTVSGAKSAPEPILGRFWDDFWSMFGTIFDRFLVQKPVLARNGKRVEFSIKSDTLNIVEELQERITQEQGNLMCPI